MKITPRFKRETLSLLGGTAVLYIAAFLCGINKTLFTSASSTFGGIVLLLACRSLFESFYKRTTPRVEG